MKLKNMKQSRVEKTAIEGPSEPSKPSYPYGLTLSLDNESLKKLGITKLPDVGSTLMVWARATVESVSEHESTEDKKPRRNISLQLTDMAIGDDGDKPSASSVLYKE